MTVLTENERNWWLERLDAALDGALPMEERKRFAQLSELDPLLADEWALATATQKALAAEEAPSCPARVHAGIEAHVRASLRSERGVRRPQRPAGLRDFVGRFGSARWRSAAAVAVVVALVVVTTLDIAPFGSGSPENPFGPAAPTAEVQQVSVARATQDVQWALAFVSDVGGAAGHSVNLGVRDSREGRNSRDNSENR